MAVNNITQTITTIPMAGKRGVDVQTIFVNKQEAFQDALTNTFVEQINTLKNQLNTFVGEVNSTATQVNTDATSASSSASLSSTKANESSASASQALTSRNQAETFKNNANDSALKAEKWAENPYNVEVETGKYSAKHYAETAQNIVNNTVDKTTNQSIDGIKTFVKSPIVPTPTNNNETANKAYVDTKVLKAPTTDNAVMRANGTTGEIQGSGVYIDDSGNVGIGTSNPSNKLHIYNSGGWNKGIGVQSYNKFVQLSSDSNVGNDIFWDNASILRFSTGSASDGTGYVERMRIDQSGNLLLTSGTGALGYGTGAGGTVTQLTSKSTPITLNKPSGRIATHNESLASNTEVSFIFYNSLITEGSGLLLTPSHFSDNYSIKVRAGIGSAAIYIKNVSGGSLSDDINLNFQIIKGANS